MISANIKIVNIDYETTFSQLFPIFKEKLDSAESKNMIVRLFQKLGDASKPVMLGVMKRLSESIKNDILVLCLNNYSVKLREKLNDELAYHPYGRYLTVGRVSIAEERNALYLYLGNVQVDYKGIVREKMSGKPGRVASFFVGEKLEKMAIKLLWTDESKRKLIDIVKASLEKYGFSLELADIQIMQDTEKPVDAIEVEQKLKLTDEIETNILNALAEYLKDMTSNQ